MLHVVICRNGDDAASLCVFAAVSAGNQHVGLTSRGQRIQTQHQHLLSAAAPPALAAWLLSRVLCSQHSEVYSIHSMWEFHLVFSFAGVRLCGKCTVFTVIYLHFGMCTSHGIAVRVFNSCQKKLLNVIQ